MSLTQLLLSVIGNREALRLYREMEECRVQAEAVGLGKEFAFAWAYEAERHRELPGAMPSSKAILNLVLKIGEIKEL